MDTCSKAQLIKADGRVRLSEELTAKQIGNRLDTLAAIAHGAEFSDKPDEMLGHVAFGVEDLCQQLRGILESHKRSLAGIGK